MSLSDTETIWANPLVRHLTVVLIVKVLLLTLLWWFFFNVPNDSTSAVTDVQTHIAGPALEANGTRTD
jgi:hypothetical protein